MALKHVAEIDANGVFLGMVEVEEDELTARHLPQISECDLKPREYGWIADAASPYGGCFEPLPQHRRPKPGGMPDLESTLYAVFAALEAQGITMPAEVTAWRQWYETTWDARGHFSR